MAAEIFNYCERGRDASFWAEPLNAWTNGAFLLAGLWALVVQLRRPPHQRTADGYLLSLLLVCIGAGSFLFHTYATRWAAVADVAPIGAFIFIYMIIALTRFVGLAPGLSLVVLAAFAWGANEARGIACGSQFAMRLDGGAGTCLNGSVGYLPALAAMLVVGIYLRVRGHPAALGLLSAGLIFAVSLTLRTLDPMLCAETDVAGMRLGVHFVWHILNALTLGILVVTVVKHWRHTEDTGNVHVPAKR